ncbi:LicD family protein [Clostridium disporicum]|uniref:LicD family protein n=1 Tax=Clostridium disporicum TaxID=84024 RepID=A0A174F9J3_9CLOT|nr:LicD family protein [Clostridium disporicum]CUO46391.1 licD family protein [Clostridium disporicum]
MDRIKEICLDTAYEFINICEKYNLRYFILGGTLLGAVRHKGFIPWDDDIDFGMPRKDYEIFMQIAKDELSENKSIKTYKDKNSKQYFIQVMDNRTKIKMTSNAVSRYENVWVDIFPLDGMPNGRIKRFIHKNYLLYRKMLIQFSDYENRINLKIRNRPIHERVLIWIAVNSKVGNILKTDKCLELMDKALKKYDYDECEYIVNFFGAYKFKEMFPKDYYKNGTMYNFENMKLVGPINYDEVLKQMYGEYMKLPPEEDRGYHHSYEIIEL